MRYKPHLWNIVYWNIMSCGKHKMIGQKTFFLCQAHYFWYDPRSMYVQGVRRTTGTLGAPGIVKDRNDLENMSRSTKINRLPFVPRVNHHVQNLWAVSQSRGIFSINTKSEMTSVTLKIGQGHPKSIGFLFSQGTIIMSNMNTVAQKLWAVSRSRGIFSINTKSEMTSVTLKIGQGHPKSIDFLLSQGTIIMCNMNAVAWKLCVYFMLHIYLKVWKGCHQYSFYPRPDRPEGYCRAPRRLSVLPSVPPSVRFWCIHFYRRPSVWSLWSRYSS